MIRWLSGARLKSAPESAVTPDPLATLSEPRKHVYQVNSPRSRNQGHCPTLLVGQGSSSKPSPATARVNPIYTEDASPQDERRQDSPRKSISSGYESRGNSSSDSSSSTECNPKPKREKRKKREKSNELIGNVLAANYSSIKRRPKKFSNGSPNGTTTHLSPIPEGQIDVAIPPPPIWPRCAGCQLPLQRVHHSGITDPLNYIYRYNERFPATSNFRVQFLKEVAEDHPRHEYQHNWEECFRIQFEKHKNTILGDGMGRQSGTSSTTQSSSPRKSRHPKQNEISQNILQDLATFLSQIMAQKNALSAEEVLLAVSQSLERSLNSQTAPPPPPTVKGEFILYGSSSSQKDDVYSTSSSSGCKDIYIASSSSSSVGSIAERLKFFQRQKEEEVYHADVEKSSEGETADNERSHHQRDLSSSSIDSSLSFSPQSSSSGKVENPVFLPDEIYSVPTISRNIHACDSASIAQAKSALSGPVSQCGSSAYEKLISAKRKVSDVKKKPCRKATTILKKVDHPYYVAMGRPDFTLDIPEAERMMNKIALAKRQRCWCRITTSFFALVFFLVSVVVVSLVVTKGKRTFGAI